MLIKKLGVSEPPGYEADLSTMLSERPQGRYRTPEPAGNEPASRQRGDR